jgi:GTP-binding protein LepA
LELVTKRRGVQKNLSFLDADRALVEYEIPLASIITDFYDKLKNVSSGYASMSYEFLEFRTGNLVRLDVLVGGEKIDALSFIAHRSEARGVGMNLCKKLKDIIPRANFVIPIQAAIGAQIIARETLSAYRKDVTAKLYGGDVTRKNKLLKKQKAGKKRMKQFGKVSLPQEAFLAVLKRD